MSAGSGRPGPGLPRSGSGITRSYFLYNYSKLLLVFGLYFLLGALVFTPP